MYDLKLRYLASVYLDADSITADPDNTAGVLEALGDKRFVPVPVSEDVQGRPVPRIGFMAPEGGWQLILAGDRFNLTLHPVKPNGENMEDFGAFCAEAANRLNAVLKYFNRSAHRLAVVREGLLKEIKEAELAKIASGLLRFSPTYEKASPFEWNYRVASIVKRKFGSVEEDTTTLVTVKRIAGTLKNYQGEAMDFDRLSVDLDLNTSPKNVKARFGVTEVAAFFKEVVKWQTSLEAEIVELLKGVGYSG